MSKPQRQSSESIAEELRKRILEWAYPPEFSFVEDGLSQEFGVSRSPVRAALCMLEADGFVKRVPNRGYFVKQVRPAEVAELYELRLALEIFALQKLAAKPELHAQVRELSEVWRDLDQRYREDATALAKLDQAFHENLVSLAGNQKILESLRRVNARLFVFRVMGFELAIERGTLDESASIHLGLAWAILSGEPANIAKALEQNIEQGRNNVSLAMGKALTKAYASS